MVFRILKYFLSLLFTAFILGWIDIIFCKSFNFFNVKFYEKTKSKYARDIDHLITFNKNGLWIKESLILRKNCNCRKN